MFLSNKVKSIAAVTLLSLGAVGSQMLFKPEPAQAAGFADSCGPAYYRRGRFGAVCNTRNGSVRESTLLLSRYIANIDGNLQWVHNGRFNKTCKNIGLQTDDGMVLLYADCRRAHGRGSLVRDYIRLDTRIQNIDGRLRYVYESSPDPNDPPPPYDPPPAYSPPAHDGL